MSDPSQPTEPPEDPRSPRPAPAATTGNLTDNNAPTAPPPPIFIDAMPSATAAQYQRASSLQSLLMLTFFFFFFSGGNNSPLGDMSGESDAKASELSRISSAVVNYQLYLNGSESNYTAPHPLEPAFTTLLPPHLMSPSEIPTSRGSHLPHQSTPRESLLFYSNITGFYRKGKVSALNLTHPNYPIWQEDESDTNTQKGMLHTFDKFWQHLMPTPKHGQNNASLPHIPALVNVTAFNHTLAEEKRGSWDWNRVEGWELSVKEREIIERDEDGEIIDVNSGGRNITEGKKPKKGDAADEWSDWAWVHCSLIWYTKNKEQTLTYDLTGVHHLSQGELTFWGMPEDQPLDIRRIPSLYTNETLRNTTGHIVLFDMLRQLKKARDSLGVIGGGGGDPFEEETAKTTSCPLAVNFRLHPLPKGYTKEMLESYEAELSEPSGIPIVSPGSLKMEGVGVFDGCGIAFGMHDGEGMRAQHFWRKSVRYATFASFACLTILMLFVNQMEATRTPSGLAKISFWSIGMMVASDSWMFSAHAVVAIMSDNSASLPMLIPAFFSLCTAMIFGPRFGVMIHRVQAPENTIPEPVVQNTNTATVAGGTNTADPANGNTTTANTTPATPAFSIMNVIRADLQRHPNLRWIVPAVIIIFLLLSGIVPQATPIFLGALYSFWVPQIWRNARRGNRKALQWKFVIGQSIARLGLPLYAFACPDNVFFLENTNWVWLLPLWQLLQIAILYAQDRFGPAFFLPKRVGKVIKFHDADGLISSCFKQFAPPAAYDYHQPLPTPDPEAPEQDFGNCSICMEPIIVSQLASGSGDKHIHTDESSVPSIAAVSGVGHVGSKVMNMNLRRTYALAPCHHLFHTECLSQWLSIKSTCPLCKRPLPAL